MSTPTWLVDATGLIFRVYYGTPPLTNTKGQPTNAVSGFINTIERWLKVYAPEHIVLVFDEKGPTQRHLYYPEYKANRSETPADLIEQMPVIRDYCQMRGLPIASLKGYEADDVIATLAERFKTTLEHFWIVSGDKDFIQLVDKHNSVWNAKKDILYDAKAVKEQWGISPKQFIDYLALMGDQADHIPGVKGIGPKTAVKLLNQYQSAKGILDNQALLQGRVGEAFRQQNDSLKLAQRLVTLDRQVPLQTLQTPDDLRMQQPDYQALSSFAQHNQFKRYLNQWQASTSIIPKTLAAWCDVQTFTEQLSKMDRGIFVWLTYEQDIGIGLLSPSGSTYCCQITHDELTPSAPLANALKQQLTRPHVHWQMPQTDIFYQWCQKQSIQIIAKIDDLTLQAYVKQPIKSQCWSDVCQQQLDINLTPLNTKDPLAWMQHGATLIHQHLQAADQWIKQPLPESVKQWSIFEQQLARLLADMSHQGVLIDRQQLESFNHDLTEQVLSTEQQIFKLCQTTFNLNSPKQLAPVLYEQLGLPIMEKTAKGLPSTSESALSPLQSHHEVIPAILQYRHLTKLKQTYTEPLLEHLDDQNRIHSRFHQTVTLTGRLSSSQPNVQNIPIRTDDGEKLRSLFVAPKDHTLIIADYSQIELRILAHFSGDGQLVGAFQAHRDVHTHTAASIFNTTDEQVTSEQRRLAKAVNFGLLYGMSAFGLAKQLGIDRQSAKAFIEGFFTLYPGIKNWMDDQLTQAKQQGYVETVTQRRIPVPDILSNNGMIRQAGERVALNAPMQGTAADLIKLAMLKMNQSIAKHEYRAKLILQVHDELVYEVHQEDAPTLLASLPIVMQTAMNLSVPIEVSIGQGANWTQAHHDSKSK
ncbi:DNA polymerase I [Gammaproteobacteria bacterium]|nr:DNA polymerase I [Gammaproteobacteria bacterium]